MARMIPHFDQPDKMITGDGAKGERSLYSYARDHFPDDWTVIYNQKFRCSKDSQTDFLVVVPGRGIVNMECKGEGYDWQNGSFYYRGAPCDPFTQAHKAIHNFDDYLRAAGVVSSKWGAFGYVLVFPVSDFREALPGNNPYVTKCKLDTLREVILNELNRYKWEFKLFSPELEQRIIEHWNKSRISECLSARAAEFRANDAEFEQMLLLEQRKALRLVVESKYSLITGGAGTGKTLIAIHAAQKFAAAGKGKQVLYVCFNRLLADDLRAQYGTANLLITNFHRLDTELLRTDLKLKSPSGEIDYGVATDNRFLRDLTLPVGKKYDAVLVDEAQDFNGTRVKVLMSLAKPDRHMAFFGDKAQCIFETKWDFPEVLCPNLKQYELDINLRNTLRIHGYCRNISEEATESQQGLVGVDVQISQKDIPSLVRELKRDGVPMSSLAVLSAEKNELDGLDAVDEWPIYEALKQNRTNNLARWREGKCVIKSSVQAFKGLESDCVVLRLGDGEISRETLYVACTRAKYRLVLSVSNENQRYRLSTFIKKTG